MLNKDERLKMFDFIKDKMTNKNVIIFYSLAKLYKKGIISKSSLLYIERCFSMVVETQNFLHLDFNLVAKILASSELNIHSEVEIFNAVITWLKHNSEERSKYAKQLLLKVRLPLLSEHGLKYILNENLSYTNNNELMCVLKEVITKKGTSSLNIKYRYCSQNKFNILLCGGYDNETSKTVRDIHQINGSNLNNVKRLPSMTIDRKNCISVCLKGEIYVFEINGSDKIGSCMMSVEKYSPFTNKWTVIANSYDQRKYFCACTFMNKIFVFGGYYPKNDYVTNSCLQFDANEESFSDKSWKEIFGMKEKRCDEACVVFQGNIVVLGGENNSYNDLNTVESYDVFANRWSQMPNTINVYSHHNLVVVKDKLFVIGYARQSYEVFDNVCKKFIALKHRPRLSFNKCVPIGNKILIFHEMNSLVVCYDVDKNEWSEESCEVTKFLGDFSFVQIPSY